MCIKALTSCHQCHRLFTSIALCIAAEPTQTICNKPPALINLPPIHSPKARCQECTFGPGPHLHQNDGHHAGQEPSGELNGHGGHGRHGGYSGALLDGLEAYFDEGTAHGRTVQSAAGSVHDAGSPSHGPGNPGLGFGRSSAAPEQAAFSGSSQLWGNGGGMRGAASSIYGLGSGESSGVNTNAARGRGSTMMPEQRGFSGSPPQRGNKGGVRGGAGKGESVAQGRGAYRGLRSRGV